MKYNTLGLNLTLPDVPFMLDLQRLYEQFSSLTDQRKAKGKRYSLAALALMALLAKFAGQNNFQQIADWAQGHQNELAALLHLPRAKTPHSATFSQVLGDKVKCSQVEAIISQHFKQLLKLVGLRGVVVTGDALQAQKALSVQIVVDGADYLWLVKANQPGLLGEIEQLFEPLEWSAGFKQVAIGLEHFTQSEKGHGRIEKRTISVSSELGGYSDWPHLEQVFK